MRKRLSLLLAAVVLVAALSGCSKQIDPLETYKQAGLKALAAKTSHQIATVTTSAAGVSLTVTTDMVIDLGTNSAAGKCTMEIPGLGGELSFNSYMVSGQLYMEWPGIDKYIAYPSDFNDLTQSIDPNKIAELASAASKPTIEDATFTVNGKEVKGKKVSLTVDTAKLKAIQAARAESASAETKELMQNALAAFDSMGPSIPLTGYIDAEGYLARMEIAVSISANGTQATANVVAECFDFGKPADIKTPTFTADNTITFQELMANPQNLTNLMPR